MELLLFLSALFASLTGVISGDRRAEPAQVESCATETAFVALSDVASGVATQHPPALLHAVLSLAYIAAPQQGWHVADVFAPLGRANLFERRLE